jgi:hypothetical protein
VDLQEPERGTSSPSRKNRWSPRTRKSSIPNSATQAPRCTSKTGTAQRARIRLDLGFPIWPVGRVGVAASFLMVERRRREAEARTAATGGRSRMWETNILPSRITSGRIARRRTGKASGRTNSLASLPTALHRIPSPPWCGCRTVDLAARTAASALLLKGTAPTTAETAAARSTSALRRDDLSSNRAQDSRLGKR